MQSLMISVSGVRGVVGESFTPEVISRFAAAFGTFCGGGTVAVGRDTRISGPMVEHAVYAGLMAAGCTIIRLGISATPTVQLAVEKLEADGGIAVTASHNPPEWNALKFIGNRGLFLSESDVNTLMEAVRDGSFQYVDHMHLGEVSLEKNFNNEHIKAILNAEVIKPDVIRKKRFRVAVDCVNGAGSRILPELLEELGCDVVKIHCEPDGVFPHGLEPIPENIGELCSTVVDSGADIGFACDPDADRLAVVDEKGIPIGEEYSLVLAAMLVFAHQPGSTATNVSTTSAVDFIAESFGRKVCRSKVGEIHVVQKMLEYNCVIGGEGNGGVILPAVHYGRDAMVGAALILQLLAEKEKKLSEIVNELPHYHISKLKAPFDSQKILDTLKKLQRNAAGAEIDTTDGIKMLFPNHWVHIRPSNTEPIIRVIAEASSKQQADEIAAKYLAMVTA